MYVGLVQAVHMFGALASIVRSIVVSAWRIASFVVVPHFAFAQSDALPSWNDGATKKSIIDFLSRVNKEGGAGLWWI
jgi:hypothetical protein